MTSGQHASSLDVPAVPTEGYEACHRKGRRSRWWPKFGQLNRALALQAQEDHEIRARQPVLLQCWPAGDGATLAVNAALVIVLITDGRVTGIPDPHGLIRALTAAISYKFEAEQTMADLIA